MAKQLIRFYPFNKVPRVVHTGARQFPFCLGSENVGHIVTQQKTYNITAKRNT